MMQRIVTFLFIFSFSLVSIYAQTKKKKINNPTDQIVLLGVNVGLNQPFGLLSERYGPFTTIGASGQYKFKNRLIMGLEYNWGFSENIKENTIFGHLIGPTEQIFDIEGYFSVLNLQHRAQYLTASLGYVIPFKKSNMNTGILVMGSIGYNQHKINISGSEVKVPQVLDSSYNYGYDRLTSGLLTRQFIGYQRIAPSGYFHFRAGIEFNQGFNQGRRAWNFQKNEPDNLKQFQSSAALKFSILLPVYLKDKNQEVFFED